MARIAAELSAGDDDAGRIAALAEIAAQRSLKKQIAHASTHNGARIRNGRTPSARFEA
jgi:hypothetical protein